MQQGMLSSVLLTAFLVLGAPSVSATEMQPDRAEQWLQSESMHNKVAELLAYVVEDNIDSLNFSLERLALPQQEVVRYLLLKKLEQQNVILTPKMAMFVEEQRAKVPTYQVLERGDGYEFSVPAFDYPAIANRLLKRWKQDQATLEFVMQAERQELLLRDWLRGSDYQVQAREKLLIRELDSLSPEALKFLTGQFTNQGVVSWLPSKAVVVRLAQVSEDPDMYHLLWRMKADQLSKRELNRLASIGDDFSAQQLMNAVSNPNLKQSALKELTRIKPMSAEVREFLITRMASSDEVDFIAKQLADQGYSSWLKELATTNKSVKQQAILSVLAN